MASNHLDKLVRSFISGSSDPNGDYNDFADTQDPTFLSFKLDFFPDFGFNITDDYYSSGGLLRPSGAGTFTTDGGVNSTVVPLPDSASEYLSRIGAPTRQIMLEKFMKLLIDIQEKAPWYFQTITGVADLWKIDPAQNFRGKDKILTIECLESIDLRMTLLAELYRNVAFDFQNMREVLPINLRTFNMNVHVLEFRKFNTTFGVIADSLATNRSRKGQANQTDAIKARKNVYGGPGSSLFTGTFNNINALGNTLNSSLGGMFTNLGDQAGPDNVGQDIDSAFEAISVQTYNLKDCEFDFYSEAPGYLETLSVKDIPEATTKFKIKVGKIQKQSYYSFYEYVIAEMARKTRIAQGDGLPFSRTTLSSPYFEESDLKGPDKPNGSIKGFSEQRKAVFDDAESQVDVYKRQLEESDYLRAKPLERALGAILGRTVTTINSNIQNGLGNMTGGLLGSTNGGNGQPMGNVYANNPTLVQRASAALNDFLTPGNQLPTGRPAGSSSGQRETLKNIGFEAMNVERTLSETNVYSNITLKSVDQLSGKENILDSPTSSKSLGKENVYNGIPPLPKDSVGKQNVFK